MALQGKVTIVYFHAKGRAEVGRLLLSAAGRDFEDKRFPFGGAEWEAYKPKTPYGMLPMLEFGGKYYIQSHGINRFLAREFGFAGKDSIEDLLIDQVQGVWEDVIQEFIKFKFEKDEAKKAEYGKEFKEVHGLKGQGYFEEQLKKNGTGYLVGNRLTLADFYLFDMHNGSMEDRIGPLDKFPLIKANIEKVRSIPGVAAYLAKQK